MHKNFFCAPVKKNINPLFTKIKTIGRRVTFNVHAKFQLNRMYRLDTRTLLKNLTPLVVMYKNSFLYFYKKNYLSDIFTMISRVQPTATCNIHTKFQLNRMHHLDAIVFTHIYTHTHPYIHHRKNS